MVGIHNSRSFLAFLATVGAAALFLPTAHSETPPDEAEDQPSASPDAPAAPDPIPGKSAGKGAKGATASPDGEPAESKVVTKAKSSKAPVTMPTKRPPDREVGRALYLQSCWQCHGETGKGDGPAAVAVVGGVPSLEHSLVAPAAQLEGKGDAERAKVQSSYWDKLVEQIEDGRGRMPAYQEDIDRHDARRILVYLDDAVKGNTAAGKDENAGDEDDNNKN